MVIKSNIERYVTPELVMARARELRLAGYVVLVSGEQGSDRWTGYCAFRTDRPEEDSIRIECEVSMRGNPHSIYESGT